jgi:hypothetical protein
MVYHSTVPADLLEPSGRSDPDFPPEGRRSAIQGCDSRQCPRDWPSPTMLLGLRNEPTRLGFGDDAWTLVSIEHSQAHPLFLDAEYKRAFLRTREKPTVLQPLGGTSFEKPENGVPLLRHSWHRKRGEGNRQKFHDSGW